jgi:GDP-L-fucose synthase
LEPTNDAYAIPKIAGILQVQAVRRQYGLPWIFAMPTNLHGPGDMTTSPHPVLICCRALIRRYDEARAAGAPEVTNCCTGTPRRELLGVDDLRPPACICWRTSTDRIKVNVGTGDDHTIV